MKEPKVSIIVESFDIGKGEIEYFKFIDSNGNEINVLRDKLTKPEWKTIIFGEYSGGSFNFRKGFKVKGKLDRNIQLKPNMTLIYKDGKCRKLGVVNVDKIVSFDSEKEIYKLEVSALGLYNNGKLSNNILDIFRFNDESETLNDIEKKKKYINGLFKINYKCSEEYINNFFFHTEDQFGYPIMKNKKEWYEIPEGKFSAYCSYKGLEEVLKEKKYTVSQLDSFVKGYRLEYDALVVNSKDPNKRLYDRGEVLATIEIKTSGVFSDDENIIKKYISSQKIEDVPHIYIAIHERDSKNGNNVNYYTPTKKAFEELGEGYISLFCKIHKDSEYIYIPEQYDLWKILEHTLKNR